MTQHKLDEEALGLMRRIIEANAWRQTLGVNLLGHCIKRVTDLEGKGSVLTEMNACLEFYRELDEAYRALGGSDLEVAVRDRLRHVPMPESRFELGVCRLLTDRAQRIALAAYEGSRCAIFASAAARHLERPRFVQALERDVMTAFCSDPDNRPRAQQAFDTWLGISLLALGRPDSPGDQRAIELGLRSTPTAQLVDTFVSEMHALAESWGLALTEPERLPLDLSAYLAGRQRVV
jgi:1,2-phenylacetyl-CoA epoxidase catalytic subunit